MAQNGDTIALPIGTFTWSTPVSFTKAVNVQGAGTDQTVICDNVPKTGGGQSSILWTFNVAPGTSIRVTGFTVHGQAQDTQVYNAGTLYFGGSSHAVRVDHITCEQPGIYNNIFTTTTGIMPFCLYIRSGTGVIFNNQFNNNGGAHGYRNGTTLHSIGFLTRTSRFAAIILRRRGGLCVEITVLGTATQISTVIRPLTK
jgi:hypothetical protein